MKMRLVELLLLAGAASAGDCDVERLSICIASCSERYGKQDGVGGISDAIKFCTGFCSDMCAADALEAKKPEAHRRLQSVDQLQGQCLTSQVMDHTTQLEDMDTRLQDVEACACQAVSVVGDEVKPLVHWTFDGTANDSGDLNMHGVMQGSYSWVDGVLGKALRLDGNGYVDLSSYANPQTGDAEATWMYWVRPDSSPVYEQVYIQEASVWLALYANGPDEGAGIDVADGGWFDGSGGTATDIMAGNFGEKIRGHEWSHIAFTLKDKHIRAYLNGRLSAAVDTTSGNNSHGIAAISAGQAPRGIGARGSGSQSFVGALDDLRIYNQALQSDQIQAIFDAAVRTSMPEPFVHWKFDEPDGATVYDSGAGALKYHGTAANSSINRVQGVDGRAVAFDGSQYIDLPDYNPQAGHSAGTWAFWLKPYKDIHYEQIYIQEAATWISLYHVGSPGVGIDISSPLGSNGWFDGAGGSTTGAKVGAPDYGWPGSETIAKNKWNHVVFTYSNRTLRGYLNGVRDFELKTDGSLGGQDCCDTIGNGQQPRRIGLRGDGAGNFLQGALDDFRIYDEQLSSVQVQELFDGYGYTP